jgi:outer membrane protein OmpA-like peptidoglycan-associated protein
MSMFDSLRGLVTPDLVAQLSAHTGESDSAVSKGLGAIMPMLMASASARANDSTFMDQFANLATRSADIDPSRSDVLSAITSNASTTSAQNWLTSLFGDGMSSLVTDISRYAGVKSSAASSLLTYAVPIVLGYIGRLMRRDNLDAAGLAARLRSERDVLSAAVPSQLAANIPSVAARPVARAAIDDRETAGAPMYAAGRPSGSGWILPLVLGALALAGLFWWIGHRGPEQTNARLGNAARPTVGTSGRGVETPKPVDIAPKVPAVAYTPTPAPAAPSSFDRIPFASGSTTVPATSRKEIRDIATMLRDKPDTRVTIAGYSDNTSGDKTNMTLSQSRADAVAKALEKQGASADQIRTEAHGSADPAASNDTAAGRAQNRRVTIVVVDHP